MKSVAPEAYHRQFLTDVFPRELETIGRRRADAGMPPIAADPSTAPGVSTRHDLTGLALSPSFGEDQLVDFFVAAPGKGLEKPEPAAL